MNTEFQRFIVINICNKYNTQGGRKPNTNVLALLTFPVFSVPAVQQSVYQEMPGFQALCALIESGRFLQQNSLLKIFHDYCKVFIITENFA